MPSAANSQAITDATLETAALEGEVEVKLPRMATPKVFELKCFVCAPTTSLA